MTAANAQTAVDEVLGASLAFITVGNGTTNGGLVPALTVKPGSRQKLDPLIALLRRQFNAMSASSSSSQPGAFALAAAVESACDGGGTQSVDPEPPPPATATSNSVSFTNCSSGGQTFNGTLNLTNIASPSAGNFTAHVSHNLTITESGAPTLVSSGNFDINHATAGNVITDTLTGGPINFQADADFAILSGPGLTLTSTVDTVSMATTDNFTGTIGTTLLRGMVTVAMPTPFQAAPGHSPNTGQMIITGANNSKVRFTVLGDETLVGNQVRIEVDPEGDGTFQPPVETTWADL